MVRSSVLLMAVAALGAMSCNNSKLVAGAACPTGGGGTAVTNASAQNTQPRPGVGAFHSSHSASFAASDATPASAQALLDALDVNFATTSVSLNDVNTQAAAYQGLGSLHAAAGSSFAWISTGVAGSGSTKALDPYAFSTQFGEDLGVVSSGCASNAFDCAQLSFSFITPDNAHSIAFDFNFMSAEFPEFVNAGYNDTFKVSLSSPSHSYDNIVYDHNNDAINIDNAFFTQPCGELTGTGFDILDFSGNCDAGGTGLLTTQAPVAPGETVTLTFTIFDSGDGVYDSAVMLDNFRFDTDNVPTPNTDPCTGNVTP